MKIYPVLLGCPKNRVDAEKFLAELKERGVTIVLDPEEAEILYVNTCAFIREAVEESLDVIFELAEQKKEGQRLVVGGCLVTRYRESLLDELPEVDQFIGIEAYRSPEVIFSQDRYCLRFEGRETPRRLLTENPFCAYLKITEGCSHACSFCTIPRIRGPLRSVPEGIILEEAKNLVAQGVQEIILVGQDVTAYGKDQGKPKLASLLRRLVKEVSPYWLRLLYLYPDGLSEEIIEVVLMEKSICPYFDIPIQHASPEILKKMRRLADPKKILSLIEQIRGASKEAAIRTSIIVGFPGETERDFEILLEFLKVAQFDHLGAFIYSPEEGTLAAKMPGQISEEEKKARFHEVMKLQQEISQKRLAKRLGDTTEVLIEGVDEEGRLVGHACFQAPEIDGITYVEGEATVGDIVPVKIVSTDVYDCFAKPLS
ncbi:MiaB-like tRNA modifying enzyme YliG [Thermodesulfatator indicus DSM 15286]|uniref:Ribosomal protein uS12 methylthiotransferase RimO n=1 Tax=Thermodesulfatator indicus (strain DSM 15286 / JCM 11887 / CIR29812) TaxID=667014 RepID=F8A9X9_THEID|nr:30S ribosomal protein S12 methylthiotransferase RimO [Thermodesulfatator indicus]AEH44180.1 MiaB-like tRNA modifying enzyme YliG [Thermodesulfatator indicus DSM 15286]